MAYNAGTHMERIGNRHYYYLWKGRSWNIYVFINGKCDKIAENLTSLQDAKSIVQEHANQKG